MAYYNRRRSRANTPVDPISLIIVLTFPIWFLMGLCAVVNLLAH